MATATATCKDNNNNQQNENNYNNKQLSPEERAALGTTSLILKTTMAMMKIQAMLRIVRAIEVTPSKAASVGKAQLKK